MRKLAILSVMMFAVALWFGGTVSATTCPNLVEPDDGCDVDSSHRDIDTIDVTSDGTNLVVTVVLCAPIPDSTPPDRTQYRLHIDHKSPTALEDDDNAACATTSDDTMRRVGRGRTTGPGSVVLSGGFQTLTFTVSYDELDVAGEDVVLLWLDTQYKGIVDRAPNTSVLSEDPECSKPQGAGEVIQYTLCTS